MLPPNPAQGESLYSGLVAKGDSTKGKIDSRRWYHWHKPGSTKEEKWLVSKLDIFILLYTCLTFFVKYLDQTNVTNAYLAGMREDLHLYGDQLNWLTTYFNIGIIVGAPISTSLLTVIQPRFWLPFCTSCWSFFVLFMYKAQNIETLYGLRFCCGLFEACAYPGSLYIIGSWYRTTEISRRTGIFLFSSTLGAMCSGYIQSGLLDMNHALGIANWRWLFILDFAISLPVALFGFFCCPSEPRGPKIWWMTEREREMSIERMVTDGRDANGKWDWSCIKRILKSWELYAFVTAWGLVEITCGVNAQRWMGLWLKSANYSKYEVQTLPTVMGVIRYRDTGTAGDVSSERRP
ncbi:hypothetical protein QQS21_004370 [Conoideocrella luteorostrata]|uniref:Major facilitator superfamily (MFS) profile domain-containing protein n=1 Tax=Conoideocrella luteorostrata TaxID=1105319 RepID=A0AAJ0CSE5_9HYPO|nr:hypothetical protein QQS21_004370 [Conoideocrella luteorostrata]